MASHLVDKRRFDALFRALGSDYLLREQFVTDPAQILTEYVRGRRLEQDQADAANQFVFATVSNPAMLQWLSSYGGAGRGVSDEQFAADLARALAKHGDEQVQLAVLRAAGEPDDLFTIQATVLRGLIAALASAGRPVFGTEVSSPGTEISSPGTEISSPGTEISLPGTEISSPGTEMSPGQVFAGTEMSSPGTEISPGSGTEMSPGQVFAGTEMSSPGTEISPGSGTEMSPGRVFAGTEMSSPGTEISPGRVFAGTEMSSPGTEISPGPGTDMSPGRFGGIDFGVTITALVEFANELRREGALDTLRFR
jgi:hypothetical protein